MLFSKKKTPEPPAYPVDYPAGIAIKTEKGLYFVNRDGKRYRIESDAVFNSWNFPLVANATERSAANLPVAVTKLGFRDGVFVKNMADGKLYLVSGGKLRHITSPVFFEHLGIKLSYDRTPEGTLLVSDSDIKNMKIGEVIS